MKAKELAEILLKKPDSIVLHEEYTGCLTECIEIKSVKFVKSGEVFENEGGEYISGRRNGFAKTNVIILG